MTILVVGGSGFIGTHIVSYLCGMGHRVVSYSPSIPGPSQRLDGCHYVEGDVTELGTLCQIMKEFRVTKVFHNAGISHPKLYPDNPYKIYRVNVTGTLTVLEAARMNHVEKFVHMSSAGVYGNTSAELVGEEERLHGEHPYGASKVACEEIVRNYGIPSVSLRASFVYGPGRQMDCPIRTLLYNAIHGIPTIWNNGSDQRLDFIYIEDMVRAIGCALLTDNWKYTEYNIGAGKEIRFSTIVGIVKSLYPDCILQVGPGDLGYDSLGALKIDRAREDFNWKPDIDIEAGIRQYASWLEKQREQEDQA